MNHAKLTRRQAEVARLVVRGLKDEQIARLLGISPRTVESLIRRGKERLGILGCHRTEYLTELVQAGYGEPLTDRKPLPPHSTIKLTPEQLTVFEYGWRCAEAAHGITGEQE